jgi:hypothetical protein
MAKTKQKERLPLELPEPEPEWKISEDQKLLGKHYIPICRKALNNGKEAVDDQPAS